MKHPSLRDTLKDVLNHPPRKLNSSLIADVYTKCTSPQDLDDLLESGFFHTVAWRFFHADVTNSHLELILQIATYEYEARCRSTCVELMKADTPRLNDLISRILQSSLTYRKQDLKLQASIFLFLRVLLLASPSTLDSHALFRKWKRSVFGDYKDVLKSASTENSSVLHCFLSFCVGCVLSSSEECKKTIQESWLPFHFLREEFDFTTQRLASLISLLAAQERVCTFTSFQISIERLGLSGKLPSAEYAASKYDVSADEFVKNLQEISRDDLVRLADFLGCAQTDESSEFLVSLITQLILDNGLSYSKLHEYTQFTENDVFDLFDTVEIVPYVPDPTIPLSAPIFASWVDQIEARNAYDYLKMANSRAQSVLERLTIIDPSMDRGIKGSSKYFSEVRLIEVFGSTANVELKNRKMDIIPGDVVLLLEIQKPNRHGGVSRLVKHGISSSAVTRVQSASDHVTVEWNSPGFEDRFNALIVLPSHAHNFEKPYSKVSSLLELCEGTDLSVSFSVDCADETVLESIGATTISKKRKLNGESSDTPDSVFKFANSEVALAKENDCKTLPEDLTRALLTMFSKRSVVVEGLEGHEKVTLMNSFLRNLNKNWPDETCLIVMPTQSAVDLFQVDESVSNLCFKCDTNNVHVSQKVQMISKSLEKVRELTQVLGLGEYDFHSSIRNALSLYHSHVEPAWRKFLKILNKDNFRSYPFFEITSDTFEEGIREIVDHFSSIRALFAQLNDSLPLDKVDLQTMKQFREIRAFFQEKSRYLVVSEQDLGAVGRNFDSIIIHNESPIPLLQNDFKRIVLFGHSTANWKNRVTVGCLENRSEIARLIGKGGVEIPKLFNPGFRFLVQHVQVPISKQILNVDEANYCVYLYQYMRSLGYPWETVSIGITSEKMRFLIEEILVEQKIGKSDQPSDIPGAFSFGWPILQSMKSLSPCDYLIVSCSGEPSIGEYQAAAAVSRMGLYLVGPARDYPYKIHSGGLELFEGETYDSTARRSKVSAVSSAAQLGELVEKLSTRTEKS